MTIKLLNLSADIRHLDDSEFNPSAQRTHRALSVLGEMFKTLPKPFINPDFTPSPTN